MKQDSEHLSPDDPLVKIAVELHKLGVSHAGVVELLGYPRERVERQLMYMPFRKAKRPEAFIVDAIRNDYSAPKEFYYAKNKTAFSHTKRIMDENAQRPGRQTPANLEGYGTPGTPGPDPADSRLEPGWPNGDLALPGPYAENGSQE